MIETLASILSTTKKKKKKDVIKIPFILNLQDWLPEPEKDAIQEYIVFLPNPFQGGNHNGFDRNKQRPSVDLC